MFDFSFESMGTLWQISVDTETVPHEVISEIRKKSDEFDQQYSRFISSSEANKFRNCVAGSYDVSEDLARMLSAAKKLSDLTDGAYDIGVATLLEQAGYDQEYNFEKAPDSPNQIGWHPPQWSIDGTQLTIDGPVVFDVGGIGKGYWIDQISAILKTHGFEYHLVDGGGDMYATVKANAEPWRIAIEYPGKPDTAISVVDLTHQGLAVSDIYKRKWKNWHHLVNAKTGKPIESILGNAAIAKTAFIADQMTSCLSFGQQDMYLRYAFELDAEYIALTKENKLLISPDWRGELFG
jgi:thiamine biosynthesis lipoprotein